MQYESLLESELRDPDFRRAYQQEKLISEATNAICEAMRAERTSRSELARLIGKTRAFVTQILSGSRNLTLRTLADSMTALGYEVVIDHRRLPMSSLKIESWPGEPEFQVKGSFCVPTSVVPSTSQANAFTEDMAA